MNIHILAITSMANGFINFFNKIKPNLEKLVPVIFQLIIGIIVGLLIIKYINKAVKKFLDSSKIDSILHGIIKQIIKIILYIILGIYIASVFKIPSGPFTAIIGSVGLAFSLAVKDTVSDIASGIIILVNKYFELGDYIEIGAVSGIVTKITLGYVELTKPDKTKIFIPNSIITKSNVINYSGKPYRRVDEKFTIGNYLTQEEGKVLLLEIAKSSKLVADGAKEGVPKVYVVDFNEDSTTYLIKVWVLQKNYTQMSYYLNEKIKSEIEKIKNNNTLKSEINE